MKIIFAGTPEFAAISLQALLDQSQHRIVAVYTQPDRPAGRGRKLTASDVKLCALRNDLEVYQPHSLKEIEAQQQIKAFEADVMIVVAYGLLLPQAVLQAPKYGCINVHASLLPRWRGAAPIQRAILAGDEQTGVTIMQMEQGLDTGPMLYKVSTPISNQDNASSLHDRLAQLGAQALLYTLDHLHQITPQMQNDAQATYAAKLSKDEARIDWRESADIICRKINAFNPWPVAQSSLNGETVRIWRASVVQQSTSNYPGEIINAGKDGIDVVTGSSVLRIVELQLPGKKPVKAAEYVNAHDVVGQKFI